MSKHHHPKDSWPIWKIALVVIVATVAGAALMWANLHVSLPPPKPPATAPASPGSPAGPAVDVPVTSVFLLFSLLSWAVAVVFAGLLAYKLYMRIPAWRRRQLFGRAK